MSLGYQRYINKVIIVVIIIIIIIKSHDSLAVI